MLVDRQPGSRAGVRECGFRDVLTLNERMNQRVVGAREAQNRGMDTRIQINVGDREGEANVKTIGHAVVGEHSDRIGRGLQRERCLQEVALEPRRLEAGRWCRGRTAIGVRKIEGDRAVFQALAAEAVEARMLIVDADTQFLATDRRCALGERRTKTRGVARVKTGLLVEAVREATGRRSQREIRQLRRQSVTECFDSSNRGNVDL